MYTRVCEDVYLPLCVCAVAKGDDNRLLLPSTLVFEARSVTESELHCFGQIGWPAEPSLPYTG